MAQVPGEEAALPPQAAFIYQIFCRVTQMSRHILLLQIQRTEHLPSSEPGDSDADSTSCHPPTQTACHSPSHRNTPAQFSWASLSSFLTKTESEACSSPFLCHECNKNFCECLLQGVARQGSLSPVGGFGRFQSCQGAERQCRFTAAALRCRGFSAPASSS